MTSRVHDSFVTSFMYSAFPAIHEWMEEVIPDHESLLVASTSFPLQDTARLKVPDGAIEVALSGTTNRWPQLILEVGYSQSVPDLRRDAEDWLLKTQGQVRSVILVKFCNPGQNEYGNWERWTAWVEIWVRSSPLTIALAGPRQYFLHPNPDQTVETIDLSLSLFLNRDGEIPSITIPLHPFILQFRHAVRRMVNDALVDNGEA